MGFANIFRRPTVLAAIAAVGLLSQADISLGAASGKTSCGALSTNPAQRAIQMALDPTGVTDFQLTMTYDPRLVMVDTTSVGEGQTVPDIFGYNGWVLGTRSTGAGSDPYVIDAVHGTVTVRGFYPFSRPGDQVPSEELDVFYIQFKLLASTADNQLLPFACGGLTGSEDRFGANAPDYMVQGQFNSNGGVVVEQTYVAGNTDHPIVSSFATVAVVPEAGDALMFMPCLALLARRSRR